MIWVSWQLCSVPVVVVRASCIKSTDICYRQKPLGPLIGSCWALCLWLIWTALWITSFPPPLSFNCSVLCDRCSIRAWATVCLTAWCTSAALRTGSTWAIISGSSSALRWVCACVDGHVCDTCVYACVCVLFVCMSACMCVCGCISVWVCWGGGVYIHACISFICLGIVYMINPKVANLKILKRLSHAGETVWHKITYIHSCRNICHLRRMS